MTQIKLNGPIRIDWNRKILKGHFPNLGPVEVHFAENPPVLFGPRPGGRTIGPIDEPFEVVIDGPIVGWE